MKGKGENSTSSNHSHHVDTSNGWLRGPSHLPHLVQLNWAGMNAAIAFRCASQADQSFWVWYAFKLILEQLFLVEISSNKSWSFYIKHVFHMWCNISTPDSLFGLKIWFGVTLHMNVKVYLSNFVQKPCWYITYVKTDRQKDVSCITSWPFQKDS